MQHVDDKCERPGGPGESSECRMRGGWFFPGALVVILAGMFLFGVIFRRDGITRPAREEPEATSSEPVLQIPLGPAQSITERPVGETIALSIDFGNGVTREFAALSWREGMTIADLMAAAAQFRPRLDFSQSGDGEMAFLTAIDGVAAEGRGGRNWIIYVGGEQCQAGIGAHQLAPGDAVLWKYEPYE